ncbi:hypothetical protein D3C76_1172160 [compost metagenome]
MAARVGIEGDQLVLVHQTDRFAGQVHVVAYVGHGFGRYALERAVAFDFFADHAGQGREGRDQLRVGLGLGDEGGQHQARVPRQRTWVGTHQGLAGYLGHGGKLQGLLTGHGLVQCVGHRQGADQNQHDQAHALLPVVGAVGKGNAGTGEDQYATYPPGGWRAAFRRLVQFLALDQCAQGQQQQGCAGETDQR